LKRLALENAHVSAILPTDAMCTERQCATVMDATFLYFDRGHLNATGSAVLGARFKLPELGAR
ncbi:MAG: SGNH hydrolase domain-containing protein, partial [Hyphomicrobiaceae bacterium]